MGEVGDGMNLDFIPWRRGLGIMGVLHDRPLTICCLSVFNHR